MLLLRHVFPRIPQSLQIIDKTICPLAVLLAEIVAALLAPAIAAVVLVLATHAAVALLAVALVVDLAAVRAAEVAVAVLEASARAEVPGVDPPSVVHLRPLVVVSHLP